MKKFVWALTLVLLFLPHNSNATFSSTYQNDLEEYNRSIANSVKQTYGGIHESCLWRYVDPATDAAYTSESPYWEEKYRGGGVTTLGLTKAPITRIKKRLPGAKSASEHLENLQNNETIVDCSIVAMYAALISLKDAMGEDEFNEAATRWIKEKEAFTIGIDPYGCMACKFMTTYIDPPFGKVGLLRYIPNIAKYKSVTEGISFLRNTPSDGIQMGDNVWCIDTNEEGELLYRGFERIPSEPRTYDEILEGLFTHYTTGIEILEEAYLENVEGAQSSEGLTGQEEFALIFQEGKALKSTGDLLILNEKAQILILKAPRLDPLTFEDFKEEVKEEQKKHSWIHFSPTPPRR